ncbi:hypothetical protein DICPUDRAFT_92877 [Dictyostelium purpureum]|uniref:Zinc/iron permease n=1 Tax=Dictyostelium purpureum TaxID=5786 RepID=F0ZYI4_DICPU|nr:uncharacterized protein DICPUDRAFT_92877 [Dictyostelium purpureum]EGC31000.1 hypothetical protein DICPUDRAFT_92877 [Dictyostelium purpureum]|eukprot:XP_003292470.1 hypothetical protein DICPUDRAFT_92877 [Dictyostelium purpureum]
MNFIKTFLFLFFLISCTSVNAHGGHGGDGTCETESPHEYDKGLHIAAVFIILACSALGAIIPILSTNFKMFRIPDYCIAVGKAVGLGVVLSCALIHMLLPAVESLSSDCLPEDFVESYEAYAYLFCMLAIIAMQFIDFAFMEYLTYSENKRATLKGETSLKDIDEKRAECHGHVHSTMLMDPAALKTIEAYLLEFGISVHSVMVGLTVGVADNHTLKALLVALSFHQFFEGVALGSRIADAKLKTHWHEALLTTIFSVSAPIGIAVGISVYQSLNVNGSDFLLVSGVLEAVCAGILLYIAGSLLFKDFPVDLDKHCSGKKYSFLLKLGLFAGFWVGSGAMAILGKWV